MTAPAIPRSTALTEAGREWGKPLTEADARNLTAQIRTSVEELLPLIRTAYQRRADLALGYASWEAYCDGELVGLRLAVADRQEAVAGLRAEGMSTRAIGAALGVSHQTVANDLRSTGQNLTVEKVTSIDGRERPASRPTPTPGPTGAALSPPADPGANPECLGVDMDCGRPLPCPDHPTLDLGASPAPAVESPAPAAPREPDPIPEPGGAMSAAQPSGSGSTAAAVPGEGGAAAAQDRFDAVLDQHVPDPDAPKRAWGRELYTRVKPVHDFLLWLKTEDVAAFADEQDVTTLRHLATGFAEAHRRAVEARTATVTPLRRIK